MRIGRQELQGLAERTPAASWKPETRDPRPEQIAITHYDAVARLGWHFGQPDKSLISPHAANYIFRGMGEGLEGGDIRKTINPIANASRTQIRFRVISVSVSVFICGLLMP